MCETWQKEPDRPVGGILIKKIFFIKRTHNFFFIYSLYLHTKKKQKIKTIKWQQTKKKATFFESIYSFIHSYNQNEMLTS